MSSHKTDKSLFLFSSSPRPLSSPKHESSHMSLRLQRNLKNLGFHGHLNFFSKFAVTCITGVKPGPQIGRPSEHLQVVSAALQAPNNQQLVETSTTEHQHPPLDDQVNQKMTPPLTQNAEAQQQPDQ